SIPANGICETPVGANVFGGTSNRNAFRWDEQCAVPVPKASMRPRSAYDEGRLIPSFADNVGIQLLVAEIRHEKTPFGGKGFSFRRNKCVQIIVEITHLDQQQVE